MPILGIITEIQSDGNFTLYGNENNFSVNSILKMSSDGQTLLTSPLFLKTASSIAIGALLDRWVCGNTNLNQNLTFGASTGAGIFLGYQIGNAIPAVLPDTSMYNGKMIVTRISEIGVASGTAYGINKYLLKNDFVPSDIYKKLGIVALTDVLAEYTTDYLVGNQLSYLN